MRTCEYPRRRKQISRESITGTANKERNQNIQEKQQKSGATHSADPRAKGTNCLVSNTVGAAMALVSLSLPSWQKIADLQTAPAMPERCA